MTNNTKNYPPFRRKRLRLEHFDYADPNHVYFATICARHLTNPFNREELVKEVIQSLLWSREHSRFRLYCYCLMPDHLHLAVSPGECGWKLSRSIGAFKSYTTHRSWQYGFRGKLWQKSWYDHIARKEEDLVAICQYILANPVRKGLVKHAEDWPYSDMVDPLPW